MRFSRSRCRHRRMSSVGGAVAKRICPTASAHLRTTPQTRHSSCASDVACRKTSSSSLHGMQCPRRRRRCLRPLPEAARVGFPHLAPILHSRPMSCSKLFQQHISTSNMLLEASLWLPSSRSRVVEQRRWKRAWGAPGLPGSFTMLRG